MADAHEIARITITEYLTEDDLQVEVEVDGDASSLVTALGLLRFAEDSIVRIRIDDTT